ncbi:aminocarboxymuconate-semialdehyde decarboxylase [Catenuloplanes nepalensis]|uniref:Aminocarboxymuconate-semialdehyde decarboxylase n=1 Tax=Catenuloplanes nepalensis TaxID=587533 RepID=A0ABT9MPN9_9ACTN|nr:amidohydrolase family protein [Catenuloplanes nepalensis]MDP9793026.1 aminocarboxymuconate-semialdehyde decarboxylase [Catenuloplanes nepalensis]
MPTIDVHAHHLPTVLGELFTELSGRRYPLRHSEDQSRRLADLDRAGVDQQVLGLGAVQPYWRDRAAGVQGARFANDLYARTVAGHPDRLRALGAVPLPHPDDAVTEAIRCLDDLGFDGIGLGCSADGIPLDDARFDPFWAEMDARGALVYLHPGVANGLGVGVSDYPMLLGPVFGSPAEQSIAVVRLALAGAMARFPGVRLLVAGMGGNLLVARAKLAESLERGAAHGSDYDAPAVLAALDGLWFDTSSIDPVLALAARQAGADDRLVFGSDTPWGSATRVVTELRTLLTPAEVDAVLARGAALIEKKES